MQRQIIQNPAKNTQGYTNDVYRISAASALRKPHGRASRGTYILLLYFLLATVAAGGADSSAPGASSQPVPTLSWTGFRGPGGLGISPDRNTTFTWNAQTGEGVRWKANVPLPGASSPIVCGERVFVTGAVEGKAAVFCFEAASGRLLWRRDLPIHGKPKFFDEATTFAAPTPVTDGQRVYALFLTGAVAAFYLDGAPAWNVDLGFPKMNYGYASSPTLHGSLLLIQNDQDAEQKGSPALVALDTATGKTVWRTNRDMRSSWSSPLVIETPSGPQIVLVSCGGVAAYDPKDGRERWRVLRKQEDVVSAATYAKGLVIAVLSGGGALAIRPDGTGEVTKTHVAWTNRDATTEVASPVSLGALVFLHSSGELLCLHAADGRKVGTRELDGEFYASPVIAGDKLYLVNREGVVSILKPDASCEVLATMKLGAKTDATPAVAEGCLYFRTEKQLLCIGPGVSGAWPLRVTQGAEQKAEEVSKRAQPSSAQKVETANKPAITASASAPATDWPCWLGPNGNGQVTSGMKLSERWPKNGPKVIWRASLLPGSTGYGSPVVADGRVYIYQCQNYTEAKEERTITEDVLLNADFISAVRWAVTPESYAKVEAMRISDDVETRAAAARLAHTQGNEKPSDEFGVFLINWVNQNVQFLPGYREKAYRAVLNRIKTGRTHPFAWSTGDLEKLYDTVNKPFPNEAAFERWLAEQRLPKDLVIQLRSLVSKVSKSSLRDHVGCFDAETGKELWHFENKDDHSLIRTAHNAGINSCTPCVVDGRVLVNGTGSQTYCLDARTGRLLWQVTNRNPPDWRHSSSFVIVEGTAIAMCGVLTAFDIETGKEVWVAEEVKEDVKGGGGSGGSDTSATPWIFEGKPYLLANLSAGVCYCVDAANGKVLWKIPKAGAFSNPAASGNRMALQSYPVFGGHGLRGFEITPAGFKQLWHIREKNDRGTFPILFQDHVFSLGSHEERSWMYCVEFATGTVKWKLRMDPPRSELAAPLLVDDKLIWVCRGGESLVMIRATTEKLELLGRLDIPDSKPRLSAFHTPAFWRGRLYVRQQGTEGAIICYDLTTGNR